MNTSVGDIWPPLRCPPWCARSHQTDDHPDDRFHQSQPTTVSGVAGTGEGVPLPTSLRASELIIRIGQHETDERPWLVIEDAEHRSPRVVMTAETARAVAGATLAQLDRLT